MRSFIKASVLMFAVAPLMATVVAKAEPVTGSCSVPSNGAYVAPTGVDPSFNFEFHSLDSSLQGSGKLYTTDNHDGTYDVIGGFASVTTSSDPIGHSISILKFSTTPPNINLSPLGAFIVNDVLSTATVHLDNWGLLFQTESGLEANIWGNGGTDNYSYYEGPAAGNYPLRYDYNVTFTITGGPFPDNQQASGVPLPSVAFLSPVLLAGFAALGRFRKQRA